MKLSHWRQAVKERAGWRCEECGVTAEQISRERIHAHHIKPRALGGKHTMDNGRCLCSTCHGQAHRGSLSAAHMGKSGIVTLRQAGNILGISRQAIYHMKRTGKLPDRLTMDAIERIIVEQEKQASRIRHRFTQVINLHT